MPGIEKAAYTEIERCRVCGSTSLIPVIHLGQMQLSGVFPRKPMAGPRGPLEVVRCEGKCGLMQLRQTYGLADMYGYNYGYRSGLNASMVEHLRDIAGKLESEVPLQHGDIVLDIGSNDGTLLSLYNHAGTHLVGIDPTAAKFKQFYHSDIQAIPDFFSKSLWQKHFDHKRAKIITSIAMFYDLEAPLAFMQDVHDVLADDGVWYLEQSYMPRMLEQCAYDTICHEHLEYYGLRQLQWMAERAEMKIVDVSVNDTNGGSFAVTMVKAAHSDNKVPLAALEMLQVERDTQVGHASSEFGARVHARKEELLYKLWNLDKSSVVLGYGASTKGNVLLQYCGIGPELLRAVVDVNADKHGCFTATGIPIVSEAEAAAMSPTHYLVLPWHFRDSIIKREQAFLQGGGKLIFPLPKVEVVGG